MRRRTPEALAASATVLWLALGATAIAAGAPPSTGWWTTANVPVRAAVAPMATDVPEGGLLLQAGPDGPSAYGAVEFELAGGEVPVLLRLRTADGSGTSPGSGVVACALTEPFEPADGGPMSDAPGYDCGSSVRARAIDDGVSFELDLASFAGGPVLALALLPEGRADRVVLAAPGDDVLEVRADPTTADAAAFGADPASSAPSAVPAAPLRSTFAVPAPAVDGIDAPPAATLELALVTPPVETRTRAAAAPSAATTGASPASTGRSARQVLAVLAVVVMVGAWTLASRNAGGRPPALPRPVAGERGDAGRG